MKAYRIAIDSRIEISYFHRPSKNDNTLIYIYGLGSSKRDFFDAFQQVHLQDYGLLSLDLVGHNDSTTPEKFTYKMKTQAKVIIKMIEKLGISDNLVLVCHSMGGPIGIYLAELLDEQIKGIVYAEGNIDENDCFFSASIIEQYSFQEWLNIGFETILESLTNMAEGIDLEYSK